MQKRAIATRDAILRAATRAFARAGLHGARIDAIAQDARVNKERIYAYYGSKDKLYVEALRTVYEMIVEEDRKTLLELTDDDIPDLTRKVLTSYMDFTAKHPEFWRMLAWENLSEDRRRGVLRGMRTETFHHLQALYRKGQETGDFSKTVSFDAYILVIISISFFYTSNMKTMSQTLNMDLSNGKTRQRLVTEMLSIISSAPMRAISNTNRNGQGQQVNRSCHD